jgi:hypothetical protein
MGLKAVTHLSQAGVSVIGAGGIYYQADAAAILAAGAIAVQLDGCLERNVETFPHNLTSTPRSLRAFGRIIRCKSIYNKLGISVIKKHSQAIVFFQFVYDLLDDTNISRNLVNSCNLGN